MEKYSRDPVVEVIAVHFLRERHVETNPLGDTVLVPWKKKVGKDGISPFLPIIVKLNASRKVV
jgi:hypothetical protein